MKFNLGQILSLATVIGKFVKKVQDAHPNAPGADKHAIVRDLAVDALPLVEGISGIDLNDPKAIALIDQVIVAEKAALNARAALEDFIADFKARQAAQAAADAGNTED